jgi:single-stranded-DNA-specific exonuclease
MNWIVSESSKEQEIFEEMSYVSSKVLSNRISALDDFDLDAFLDPKLSRLHPPETIKGVVESVDRIVKAVESGEKIRIHGDYDADGVTSTYVIYKTLCEVGADVEYSLPNRELDGYGLSSRFVEACIDNPCLIITVDCGITENEKIAKLKENGIDVIITDHHKVGPLGIPEGAYSVVDPKQDGETSHFKSYAGVGVSFMVSWAISKRLIEEPGKLNNHLKSLIPFVSIGTIADVMPLVEDNRILTKVGLDMIRKGKINDGVRSLIDVSGLELHSITAKDIGFMVAPRINSAGRMEDPSLALDCFLSSNRFAASKLNQLNEARKEISQELVENVTHIIESNNKIKNAPVIVVSGTGWHHGIVGIVAGKIAETYGKPTIIISVNEDGIGKGSGRSVQNFDLYSLVSSAADVLEGFGGHAQALGVAVKEENVDKFRNKMARNLKKAGMLEEGVSEGPSLYIDCEVSLASITPQLMKEIDKLGPFGEANPEPVFAVRDVDVLDYKPIGRDKNHLSVTILEDGRSMRGVSFFAENLISLLDEGVTKVDVAFTPVWNSFNGRTNLEMMIKDINILK